MKKLQNIITLAIAVVFVVALLVAMFSGGRSLSAVLKTYVLKYESCEYNYPKVQSREVVEFVEPDEVCKVDYNGAKRDIAEGVSLFAFSFPVAFVAQRKLKELVK